MIVVLAMAVPVVAVTVIVVMRDSAGFVENPIRPRLKEPTGSISRKDYTIKVYLSQRCMLLIQNLASVSSNIILNSCLIINNLLIDFKKFQFRRSRSYYEASAALKPCGILHENESIIPS